MHTDLAEVGDVVTWVRVHHDVIRCVDILLDGWICSQTPS